MRKIINLIFLSYRCYTKILTSFAVKEQGGKLGGAEVTRRSTFKIEGLFEGSTRKYRYYNLLRFYGKRLGPEHQHQPRFNPIRNYWQKIKKRGYNFSKRFAYVAFTTVKIILYNIKQILARWRLANFEASV